MRRVEKQLKAPPGHLRCHAPGERDIHHRAPSGKEIAKLTKNGPLFLVDGVTAVGSASGPAR